MGSKKKKTTQTYRPPSWVENQARQASGIAGRIASQQYTPYEGERVAGLSENEQMGMEMARDNAGIATPYMQEAAALTRRSTQSFTDPGVAQQYMNPYIESALDPAARKIREQGQRDVAALEGRAASMDAFGGSRAALLRSETEANTRENIGDLYKQGMAEAYQQAASLFGQERARDLEAAGRIQNVGQALQNASQTDINTLMASGAVDRNIRQAANDFNYQQFIEGRDWDFRSLGAIISALEGTKGSYTTTQTTTSKESGGELAQAMGLGAALLGAFFTGGASTAATGAAAASDERLKENIVYLFTEAGRRFYSWTWNSVAVAMGINDPTIGVIAQENPDISFEGPHGYLMVDYARIAE